MCSASARCAFSGLSPGARRVLMRARDTTARVLEEVAMEGMSMPMTEIAGWVHRRDATDPVPARGTVSRMPESLRKSASAYSSSGSGARFRPSTATVPVASCRVASSCAMRVWASSMGPPNMPEWMAWLPTCTSMSPDATPRRLVVSAGTPARQLAESATTM